MRFFKAFSLLHRRTKSDGAIVEHVPNAYVRAFSFPGRPARNDIFDAFVPSATTSIPIAISTSDCSPLVVLDNRIRNLEAENAELKSTNKTPAVLCERIHALESEFTQLKHHNLPLALSTRIEELESEKRQLNSTVQLLLTTITELSEDGTKTRCDLHELYVQGIYLRRQAKEDEEEIERLEAKLAQYVKFVGMMVDIGLHETVLDQACTALKAGEDADEALIDAIKEASANPGSPWSKIIPAVTGPRTSDEYLSAIGMTLRLRREVKDSRKVAKFWKRAARETQEHASTFTPSVSNISSIREQLGEERQTAVDDLLAKLRSGTYPRRLIHSADRISELASLSESTIPRVDAEPLNTRPLSLTSIPETATSIDPESHTVHSSASTHDTIKRPNLAPLASQSFKEEFGVHNSYKNVSFKSQKRQSRTILGDLDLGRYLNRSNLPPSESTTSHGSKRSAREQEKRRAMVVTQSLESIQAVYSPTRRLPTSAITPCTDQFTDTLSRSLLAVKQERQPRADPRPLSGGSIAFDNSAFSHLVAQAGYTPEPLITPNRSSVSVSGTRTSDGTNIIETRGTEYPSPTLSEIPEESRGHTPASPVSPDETANSEDNIDISLPPDPFVASDPTDISDDFVATYHHHDSSVKEPISPDMVPTSLSSESDTTPVKKSRLPVMKHFRRLSMSPISAQVKTLKTQTKSTPTAPLSVSKKNAKNNANQRPVIGKTLQVDPVGSPRLRTPKAGHANGSVASVLGKKAVRRLGHLVS